MTPSTVPIYEKVGGEDLATRLAETEYMRSRVAFTSISRFVYNTTKMVELAGTTVANMCEARSWGSEIPWKSKDSMTPGTSIPI